MSAENNTSHPFKQGLMVSFNGGSNVGTILPQTPREFPNDMLEVMVLLPGKASPYDMGDVVMVSISDMEPLLLYAKGLT